MLNTKYSAGIKNEIAEGNAVVRFLRKLLKQDLPFKQEGETTLEILNTSERIRALEEEADQPS
jgi:hypothetical protein